MWTDDFLEYENNNDLLQFKYKFKEILIWPYIRHPLINLMASKYENAQIREAVCKTNRWMVDNIYNNTFKLKKSDIMFITTSRALIDTGKYYEEKIVQSFIDSLEGQVAVLIDNEKEFDYKRIKNKNFATSDYIEKLILAEESFQYVDDEEYKRIDEFLEYLKNTFPYPLEQGWCDFLRKIAIERRKRFPLYYKYYGKLINYVKPKVVFCCCGMYSRPIIKVMNDMGIITAEFQHGMIGKFHPIYSLPESMSKNPLYRQYMPKYFLSFGNYWTKNIFIPSSVYVVGNATVEKEYNKRKKTKVKENNILFIPGGNQVDNCRYLDEILDDLSEEYSITIKLHPDFPNLKNEYRKYWNNQQVIIATDGSIYDYIMPVKYVVGGASTSMFEAAAMGKTLFVFDNPETRAYFQEDCGVWITSGKEIRKYIEQDNKKLKQGQNQYFSFDTQINFKRFLDSIDLNSERKIS